MKYLHGRHFREFRSWPKNCKFILPQTCFRPLGLLYHVSEFTIQFTKMSSYKKFEIKKRQNFTSVNISCFTSHFLIYGGFTYYGLCRNRGHTTTTDIPPYFQRHTYIPGTYLWYFQAYIFAHTVLPSTRKSLEPLGTPISSLDQDETNTTTRTLYSRWIRMRLTQPHVHSILAGSGWD